MKFDQDFIEKVREATNLVDVVSQHVELKKSGGGYVGLCPFHGEKTPSFSVSEDKQVYHCFGCKASGNVYSFVQANQGLTFPEAVEYLAKRAGLAIPESSKSAGHSGDKDKKDTLYRINEVASCFFQGELGRLKDDHPVWTYVRNRGISREFATKHRLGYAPDSWTSLVQAFESRRVPLFIAASLGLVKKRTQGKDGYYSLFRNRVIFPIYSPTEACLGFGGRVLDSSQQPKYLNSPDSPVFHKGQVLYGLDRSAKHIRSADTAILVEGYTDWLALDKAGFHNAVATLGTAFTPNHARLLRRYCSNVIVLFDGDEAGRIAARRSLSILLDEGLFPKGVLLPYELDPDEFIEQHGAQALKHALDRALDLYDLIVEEEIRGHTGEPTDKVKILDRLAPLLASVPDPRLRALYVQNTANYLNVEPKLVQMSLAPIKPLATSAPKTQGVEEASAASAPAVRMIDVVKPPRLELDLLNVALLRETYFHEIMAAGIVPKLSNQGIQEVFEMAAEAYGQRVCKFDNLTTLLVSRVRPPETVTHQLEQPLRDLTEETARKYIHDCIHRIEENHRKAQSRAIMSDMRGAQGEKRTEKMEQFMNVQRTRRQINQEN